MSGPRKALQGLTAPLKERLIQEALQRRMRKTELERSAPARAPAALMARSAHTDSIPDSWCRFDMHPDYQQLRILNEGAEKLGVGNPFFRVHDGTAGATTVIGVGRAPASQRGREGGDRPLRHVGVGQPAGLGGAPHPPRARTGAGRRAWRGRLRRVRERPCDQCLDDRPPVRTEGSDRA